MSFNILMSLQAWGDEMQILLAGATGLIGTEVLRQCELDSRIDRVCAVTRKPLPRPHGAKCLEFSTNFARFPADFPPGQYGGAICALGTTMAKAGSKEAFRAVDFDYVLNFANWVKRNGVEHFTLVSAMNANRKSLVFYNRVKGEIEDAVAALNFPKLTIIRPGLLLGQRVERRPGESIAIRVHGFFKGMLPRAWQGVAAEEVAKVLLAKQFRQSAGLEVIANGDLPH